MLELNCYQKRLYAEIDLDGVRHNFYAAKEASPGKKIICVVKANAYGHGAVQLSRVYEKIGADMLAVSNIEEAMELRRAGLKLPILILGYTTAECAKIIAEENFEQCVFSLDYARALSEAAVKCGVSVKIHLKIDTGMGRIGFICRSEREEDELDDALIAAGLDGLSVVGMFTHFAVADGGDDGEQFTRGQARCFGRAIEYLRKNGVDPALKHLSNSAAIYEYPDLAISAVRPGISLYGEVASHAFRNMPSLKNTLTLRTYVANVKTVKCGESVGYGRAYIADKEMRVATLPIGYADGLLRSASHGKGVFTVNGKPARVLGRICMDQTMIDVTGIDDVSLGTPVTVFGKDAVMDAGVLADTIGTIAHENFTGINRRVPRVYVDNGEIVEIVDYMI